MGLMTERWVLSIPTTEEEGLSSSSGSCFTTTAPAPRMGCSPEVGGDRRSSGLILHTGPWATNMNSSFSFSFCSSAISFCRPDFSSSSSSVSWEGREGCEGQADLRDPRCPQMTYHKRLTHLAGELTGCESHGGSVPFISEGGKSACGAGELTSGATAIEHLLLH